MQEEYKNLFYYELDKSLSTKIRPIAYYINYESFIFYAYGTDSEIYVDHIDQG